MEPVHGLSSVSRRAAWGLWVVLYSVISVSVQSLPTSRIARRLVLAVGVAVLTAVVSAAAQEPRPDPETPPVRLPPVEVTGTRLPGAPLPVESVPATVDVIPGARLRSTGEVTLQEALRRLPGVSIADQQGNSFQMDLLVRGFQGTSVTGAPQGISVFVDGVRVNEPTVEEINFDLLPLDDVERVELIRGPSAVFGRNTLGGVLNIVTRRGAETREIVPEAEWGSFGRQKYRLRIGGTGGPIDYYVAGTFFSEDGWRDASAGRVGRLFARLGLRDGGTDLSLSYQRAQNRIEQPGSLPESELDQHRTRNFTRGDFFAPLMNAVTLNLKQELGERWALATTLFARTLDSEQFNVNLADTNARSFTSTATAGGTVEAIHQATPFGRSNRLVLGVEYAYADARVRVFEETSAGEREIDSDVRDGLTTIGGWMLDTLDLGRDLLVSGDQLVLTAGARFDYVRHAIGDRTPDPDIPSAAGTHTFMRTTPRFGINYNPTPRLNFYFSFAEGFRAPSFLELTCASPATICPGLQAGVAADPPLKPVTVRSYEVGARVQPWPWLEGRLALYRSDVQDDIFSVAPTGTVGLFFQNVGDTRRQGVEASLRAKAGRVEPWVNYAYTEATFRDEVLLGTSRMTAGCAAPPCTQLVRKGSELPLVPRHRVNAGIDARLVDWLTLSLSGAYVGRQWLRGDEANAERQLGDYVVLNASLTARVKALTAFVAVQNLLDTEYETFGTFAPNFRADGAPVQRFLTPAPPINIHAGLAWRF
jgi:outer membrane receptor protein involved in Fe transport